MTAPLLATRDDLLRDDVLRLAAAAGVEPVVTGDLGAAVRAWRGAGPVLVGADLVDALSRVAPPRRPGVIVVERGEMPDERFRAAFALGADQVASLPTSGEWLMEVLAESADGGRPAGLVVGVVGGSGGVGASVVACALAQWLAREGDEGRAREGASSGESSGRSVLLVDADPLGAGADRLLGLEATEGVRWDSLVSTTGRLSARSLRESLPMGQGVRVLAWPASSGPLPTVQPFAVREVLAAARRGHDVTVVDLPRHPDQAVEEALVRCDELVLVAGDTVAGVSAAARVAARLAGHPAHTHLVLRAGRGVRPEQVAEVLGLGRPILLEHQRGLDEAVDLGVGPLRSSRGPLARAVRALAAELSSGSAVAA